MALMSYDTVGAGPAVLLLHAGVADRRMWVGQRDALAPRHQVVRVDLRGFGDSPLPQQPYDHVADLVAVLDALRLDRAAVVGASFGGLVAQDLAIRHPDRIARLVLLCPASVLLKEDAELRAFASREQAFLEAGDLDGAADLNVEQWCGPEADDAARALVFQMQRRAFDLQTSAQDLDRDPDPENPAAIIAPTLVVSGGQDAEAFRTSARELARVIPAAEHRELAWAGHLPSLERPQEVSALLLDALAATP